MLLREFNQAGAGVFCTLILATLSQACAFSLADLADVTGVANNEARKSLKIILEKGVTTAVASFGKPD